MVSERLSIAAAAGEVTALAGKPVPYSSLWSAAVAGEFPTQRSGRILTVAREDLRLIAEIMLKRRVRRIRTTLADLPPAA